MKTEKENKSENLANASFQVQQQQVLTKKKAPKTDFWKRFEKIKGVRKEQLNKKTQIYKITLAAVFLALSIPLSLFEIHKIPLPFGAPLDLRFFDNFLLFIALRMVGLSYTLLIGLILPWLHVAVDGDHSPISMIGFELSNVGCVLVFWGFYFHIFKAQTEKLCYDPPSDVNTVIRNHKFNRVTWTRKISAFSTIATLCAAIEALSVVIVFAIATTGVGIAQGGDYSQSTLHDLVSFNSIATFWIYLIFVGIFLTKYIFNMIVYAILEKRLVIIAEHYAVR